MRKTSCPVPSGPIGSPLHARIAVVESTARTTSCLNVSRRTDCMNLRISEVPSVLNPLPRLSFREHDSLTGIFLEQPRRYQSTLDQIRAA